MVTRREDSKSSGKKSGGSLNEEDYFTKMNEEALKKIGQAPGKKETDKK